MMYDKDAKPQDFKVGQRVELHPACDLWMMGARYATVTNIGKSFVHIRLDVFKRVYTIRPSLLSAL